MLVLMPTITRYRRYIYIACLNLAVISACSADFSEEKKDLTSSEVKVQSAQSDAVIPNFGTSFSESIQPGQDLPDGFTLIEETELNIFGRFNAGDLTVEFGAKHVDEGKMEIIFGQQGSLISMQFDPQASPVEVFVYGESGRAVMTPEIKQMLAEIPQILGTYFSPEDLQVQINLFLMNMLSYFSEAPDGHEYYTGMLLE